MVAEVGDGSTKWEFVRGYKLQARPFITVYADIRDAADPTSAVVAAIRAKPDLSKSVVRVIVRMRQEQESLLIDREIAQALEGAYFVAAMQKDVERSKRQGIGEEAVEA